MTPTTNPEFLYELKIGISALMRACYEVIGACNQIEYSIRLLDKDKDTGVASTASCAATPTNTEIECQLCYEEAGSLNCIRPSHPTYKPANPVFTPTTKPIKTKGDPLAELAAQMNPQDREQLIAAMEGKK